MAKSIRVSDEFYKFAETIAHRSGRSLAQQVEYWARVGARVDMGLPPAQVLALLDDALDVPELLSRFAPAASQAGVLSRHARLEAEVAEGRRDPASLAVIPKALAQAVELGFPVDAFGGAKAW